MNTFHKEDFKSILATHGIQLSQKQEQQFQQYAYLLQEWNKKMNLTAITETNAIYEKHFLDSILPSFDVSLKGTLCDVGAGAGFPSIPLKLVYPDLDVTIVEPLGKRITFLTALCEALELDVHLENARAEEFAKDHRAMYDIVTARAVANLPVLSELCIPLVKKKGIFLAMKGASAQEEAIAAKNAIKRLGCELRQSYEKELSDGSKRINLVYEKMTETPRAYPRAFAQIKKHPL